MKNELFYRLFNNSTPIQFDPHWGNGTGYYDHAARGQYAPKLSLGEVVASVSPMPNNREIVIIGLGEDEGNLVFFERYTGGERDIIVSNGDTSEHPANIQDAMSGRVTEKELTVVCDWVARLININGNTDGSEGRKAEFLSPWSVICS